MEWEPTKPGDKEIQKLKNTIYSNSPFFFDPSSFLTYLVIYTMYSLPLKVSCSFVIPVNQIFLL